MTGESSDGEGKSFDFSLRFDLRFVVFEDDAEITLEADSSNESDKIDLTVFDRTVRRPGGSRESSSV
jgi:hypothetical protein